jgi:hypothetical protein
VQLRHGTIRFCYINFEQLINHQSKDFTMPGFSQEFKLPAHRRSWHRRADLALILLGDAFILYYKLQNPNLWYAQFVT